MAIWTVRTYFKKAAFATIRAVKSNVVIIKWSFAVVSRGQVVWAIIVVGQVYNYVYKLISFEVFW
jgi:hypothetical protein